MPQELLGGIPLVILIVGALLTKRIIEPAFLSSAVSVFLLYKEDFFHGYLTKMYEVLGNPSFQLLIIVGVGFTGSSALLERSGAMLGFRTILEKWCKSRVSCLFFTWLLGGIIFIDDYLNALAVSAAMKGISDKLRVPREHLAYTVNCMGACVCTLLPFSSWAVFAVGCAGEQGLGMDDYIRAVPLMFYPICAILISLLLALGRFPRIGELRRAYARVDGGGPILAEAGEKAEKDIQEQTAPPVYFLVPMLALIAGMLVFDKDIIVGLLIGLTVMLVMYRIKGLMDIHTFFDTFLNGSAAITPMLITIYVTYIMEMCIEEMGFTAFLTEQMSRAVPGALLPVIAFLSVAGITFFAASFWTLIVIAFPIFLPMAAGMGVYQPLVIGAVMSGVALGSQACLYSDAVFMVAAGTDVPNDTQFRVVVPYVVMGVIPAAVLFLAAGLIL